MSARRAPRAFSLLVAATLALSLTTARVAPAQQPPADAWRFRVAPYLWILRIEGNWTVGPVASPADRRYGNVFQRTTLAGALYVELGRGRWSAILEGALARSEGVGDFERAGFPAAVEGLSSRLLSLECAGAYRVGPRTASSWVEFLAGARYTALLQRLEPTADATRTIGELRKAWLDPVLGLRIHVAPHQRFSIVTRADVGGFGVGADFTWSYRTAAALQLTRAVALALEYKLVDVDYADGPPGTADRFVYDGTSHGLIPQLRLSF